MSEDQRSKSTAQRETISAQSPARRDTLELTGEEAEQVDASLRELIDQEHQLPRLDGEGGRYIDLGEIGRGGMGEVRRVFDRELGRILAVKLISTRFAQRPQLLARFIEEAQVAARLEHPNIVPIYDLGLLEGGRFYFSMKEVIGDSLSVYIKALHARSSADEWAPLTDEWNLRRLLAVFKSICDATSYAHSKGVIHRDLKPDNVMIGLHGEVLLLDWGIAKRLDHYEEAWRQDLTQAMASSMRKHLSAQLTPQTKRFDQGADTAMTLDGSGVQDHELSALDTHLLRQTKQRPSSSGITTQLSMVGSSSRAHATSYGTITGTLGYMAPEQLRGEIDLLDARTDVYALGALLFELLTCEVPFKIDELDSAEGRVEAALKARAALSWPKESPPIPEELKLIVEEALCFSQEGRTESAQSLGRAIALWLDGAGRQEKALSAVGRARAYDQEAARLKSAAEELEREGLRLQAQLKPWQPEEDKQVAWAQLDQAEQLSREATLSVHKAERALLSALTYDERSVEAHSALSARYLEAHRAAELNRDQERMARFEHALRDHAPQAHQALRERIAAYLSPQSKLSLSSSPPGCQVLIQRYELKGRRLILGPREQLGVTPLVDEELELGTYRLTLEREGYEPALVPVSIERERAWHNIPPAGQDPEPIVMIPKGSLPEGLCYVPGGWLWVGGDDQVSNAPTRRRIWVDSFLMARAHVTHREYVAFLNELVERGERERAYQLRPKTRDEEGDGVYRYDPQGGFTVIEEGAVFLDAPVNYIDFECAQAYCAWRAERDRLPWRLPRDMEWEKAARGVDARYFPWGNSFDPSWCCMRQSHEGEPRPYPDERWPIDEGPYGQLALAGGIRDWCEDAFSARFPFEDGERYRVVSAEREGAERVVRGGSWKSFEGNCRVAFRFMATPQYRDDDGGLRLACSLEGLMMTASSSSR